MYDFERAKQHFAARMQFTTGPFELSGQIGSGEDLMIVDVRLPSDYAKARIPGAINLPYGKWHTAAGLSRDRINVVYCYNQQCHLAAGAALEFARAGYPVVEMEGGFETWTAFGLPVEGAEQAVA